MLNHILPSALFLLVWLTAPAILLAQTTNDSLTQANNLPTVPQVTPATQPEAILYKPREVRVRDTLTRKKFWLVYQNHQELISLRKAGFVILRTRRIRNPDQPQAWQMILKDIFTVVIQSGVPVLMRRSESGNNPPATSGG